MAANGLAIRHGRHLGGNMLARPYLLLDRLVYLGQERAERRRGQIAQDFRRWELQIDPETTLKTLTELSTILCRNTTR